MNMKRGALYNRDRSGGKQALHQFNFQMRIEITAEGKRCSALGARHHMHPRSDMILKLDNKEYTRRNLKVFLEAPFFSYEFFCDTILACPRSARTRYSPLSQVTRMSRGAVAAATLSCFNCGGPHGLKAYPERKDEARIIERQRKRKRTETIEHSLPR